jgi:hypothetical protein
MTTLAVFRPTPGSVNRSSIAAGTRPPKRPAIAAAAPMRLRVLFRKKPVGLINSSTRRGSATVNASGRGYARNSAGVTWFTVLSVDCAERIVATRSS